MGLYATAKGLDAQSSFDCGYLTYANFIDQLVKAAYDERCYAMFHAMYQHGEGFTEEDAAYWNAHCNDDLDVWIWHSDCEGVITPKECRAIYNAIKGLSMDVKGHNYREMESYNMLEHWKAMFLHCARRRVNLRFC